MKIYVIGENKKETEELVENLSTIYNIPKFEVENIDEINKIIRTNREWIITSSFNDNSNVIANASTTVIYLNFNKENNNEFIRKYKSKIIILKSKKEIKKLFKAIYEGIEL